MLLLLLYVYEDLMLKQLADSACVRRGWPSPASCFRLGCSCIHNACTKTPLAGSPSSLAIAWDKYGLSQPWKSHPRFPCCRVHPMSPLLSCLLYSVRRTSIAPPRRVRGRQFCQSLLPCLTYTQHFPHTTTSVLLFFSPSSLHSASALGLFRFLPLSLSHARSLFQGPCHEAEQGCWYLILPS